MAQLPENLVLCPDIFGDERLPGLVLAQQVPRVPQVLFQMVVSRLQLLIFAVARDESILEGLDAGSDDIPCQQRHRDHQGYGEHEGPFVISYHVVS